jgi:hypothetical protein
VREIEDIEKNIASNPNLARRFIDLNKDNTVDLDAQIYLKELKYKKIPEKLPESNTFRFNVKDRSH